jgi:hypothetical protein
VGGGGRFCFPFFTTIARVVSVVRIECGAPNPEARLRLSGLHLLLVMMALPIVSLSTSLRHLSLTTVVKFPSVVLARGSCVAQLSVAFVLNFVSRALIEVAVTCIARVACGRIVYLSSLNRDILAGRYRHRSRASGLVNLRSLNRDIFARCYRCSSRAGGLRGLVNLRPLNRDIFLESLSGSPKLQASRPG